MECCVLLIITIIIIIIMDHHHHHHYFDTLPPIHHNHHHRIYLYSYAPGASSLMECCALHKATITHHHHHHGSSSSIPYTYSLAAMSRAGVTSISPFCCFTLPTMLMPRRKRAVALKELARVVKTLSRNDGSFWAKTKLKIVPSRTDVKTGFMIKPFRTDLVVKVSCKKNTCTC